ncbi:MAG TPA: helix-turn-helix domain-containing protein [Blastocatellia bacterium]|nr:helix-turn-helix domain-containing protein [Blastocatellia bacterium]
MPTLGEELKRRREERQIALTDISEATRIGTRFLKAIEADNYGVLPGGIFTRSFIRAYAKQVGMDEDEAIALYQQQTAGVSAEPLPPSLESRPQVPVETPRPTIKPPPRRTEPVTYKQSGPGINWTTVVIGGGIAIFIILIVLALVRQLNRTATETPTRANTNSNTASSTPGNPPPSSNTSATAPPVSQGEPLIVKFEATVDDCSIRYWIDDAQKPSDVTVKKGASQSLPPAQNQVRLSIGNRPAVKMSINDREAHFPDGTPNWGAKLTVSRDNLQTYFQ